MKLKCRCWFCKIYRGEVDGTGSEIERGISEVVESSFYHSKSFYK